MHKEVLTARQTELLPIIKSFKREFYLVEGTAIALYIGHRRSIDFDLFKKTTINHKNILSKLNKFPYPYIITRKVPEQLNLTLNEVKITFFEYPFLINARCEFEKSLRLPELLDLAAMKAYALGEGLNGKTMSICTFYLKTTSVFTRFQQGHRKFSNHYFWKNCSGPSSATLQTLTIPNRLNF